MKRTLLAVALSVAAAAVGAQALPPGPKVTISGEKRYDVHAMVRQYVSAQLQFADEIGWAHALHIQAFINLAETIEPKLIQSGQSHWLMYMEIEHDNFRAAIRQAFESGDSESAVRLSAALWRCLVYA